MRGGNPHMMRMCDLLKKDFISGSLFRDYLFVF